jgi:hypothetical protein
MPKFPKKQHNCKETIAAFSAHMQSSAHMQNIVKRNSEPDPEIDSIIAILPSLPKDDALRTFVSLLDVAKHGRDIPCQAGVVVSGASPHGGGRLAALFLGRVGKESASEILPAHQGR